MRTERTSERLIAEDAQDTSESRLIFAYHLATYKYCIRYVADKRVLDYGCGSGYGTALVSEHCRHAIGIDVSPEAIHHARENYRRPNLEYRLAEAADVRPLPFVDGAFDVVISLQVIEHVRDVDRYLKEIRRACWPPADVP